MRNYFHIDDDGSLELRLGPLYVTSMSQLEPLPDEELYYSFGFFDVYLDLPRMGLFHLGMGSNIKSRVVFEKLDVF